MLITCPECRSEFDVPEGTIGPEGRKLRCASCRHVWHQGGPHPFLEATLPPLPESQPNPEPAESGLFIDQVSALYEAPKTPISATGFEIEFEEHADMPPPAPPRSFEDIVRESEAPVQQTPRLKVKLGKGRAKPAWPPKAKKEMKPLSPPVRIAGSALLTALGLGLVLVLGAQTLADASPFLRTAYIGLGMEVRVPGEGIGIDRVILRPVWSENGTKAELSTRLLNLTDHEAHMAPIEVAVMDESGKPTGKAWHFPPPVKILPKDGNAPFNTTLAGIPDDKESLTLRVRLAP